MGKEMYGQSCFGSREENVSKKINLEKNPMVQKSRFTSSVNVKAWKICFGSWRQNAYTYFRA